MDSWCIQGLNSINSNIGENSWKHGNYSYFPEEELAPVDTTVQDEMVEYPPVGDSPVGDGYLSY